MLPGATQGLSVLDNAYFSPVVAGFMVFGVVGGLAAAVSTASVRWMGSAGVQNPRRCPRESRTSPSPQHKAAPQATPRNEARFDLISLCSQ